MLRLWRERLLLSLAPDAVSWIRLHRGFKPAVYDKRSIAVAPEPGREPWQEALAALRTQAAAWEDEPMDVSIVLSNQFVRYALVTQSDALASEQEYLALARIQFSRIHGERAQQWDIRLSPAGNTSPRLASAIDNALMQGMAGCFAHAKRARLVSVQPWLMSAFNIARAQWPAEGAWLLLIEPQRACAALLLDRNWVAVHNVKGQFQDPAAWSGLLEQQRWRLAGGRMSHNVLIHTQQAEHTPQTIGPWHVKRLESPLLQGIIPSRDQRFSAALTLL